MRLCCATLVEKRAVYVLLFHINVFFLLAPVLAVQNALCRAAKEGYVKKFYFFKNVAAVICWSRLSPLALNLAVRLIGRLGIKEKKQFIFEKIRRPPWVVLQGCQLVRSACPHACPGGAV